MKFKKRAASLLLASCMALTSAPAFAVDTIQSAEQQADIIDSGTCGVYSENNGQNVRWTLDSNGTLAIIGNGDMGSRPWQADKNIKNSIRTAVINYGVTNVVLGELPNLVSVTIPSSVTEIGERTFAWDVSLRNVVIPESVTVIRERAFFGCGIESIKIPNSIIEIESGAFRYCRKLKNITLSENITSIRGDVFSFCESLTSINIPANVKTIEGLAFVGCENLKSIYFNGNAPKIQNSGDTFMSVTATAYYPAGNSTWTEDVRQNYGGEITWKTWNPPSSGSEGSPNFTDIPSNSYYTDAVKWAVDNNITSGTSPTTFSPDRACTRAEIITMLWRAMGSYQPHNSTKNPFTDVRSNDYFYKPVLWAIENKVTNGTSATKFSPNQVCTRAQTMTLLWSTKGKPTSSVGSIGFLDIRSSDYYYKAIIWAVNHEITNGTSATTFSPNQDCTRAQVVTFLYKAMG